MEWNQIKTAITIPFARCPKRDVTQSPENNNYSAALVVVGVNRPDTTTLDLLAVRTNENNDPSSRGEESPICDGTTDPWNIFWHRHSEGYGQNEQSISIKQNKGP